MAWYKTPVMITEGKMQYLFDETGRRYLDVSQSSLQLHVYICLTSSPVTQFGHTPVVCAHTFVKWQVFHTSQPDETYLFGKHPCGCCYTKSNRSDSQVYASCPGAPQVGF